VLNLTEARSYPLGIFALDQRSAMLPKNIIARIRS
jgi:hypothetical protein